MRSQPRVPDSCSSKHHSRLWVPPSSDSFSVQQPITSIHSVSHTNTTVLSPNLFSLTLQPVAQGQHHPGILYPTAYIFRPPVPNEKCKGKFLAASANLTSQGLFAQRDNNHSSSQDTISSRQGKSGSPDS